MLPCRSRHGAHYYVKGGGTTIVLPYYFCLMNMVVYFAPPECDGVLKFLCGNEMNAVDTTWHRLIYSRRASR